MYGESCLEKCDCQSHQECNNIHGCLGNISYLVVIAIVNLIFTDKQSIKYMNPKTVITNFGFCDT